MQEEIINTQTTLYTKWEADHGMNLGFQVAGLDNLDTDYTFKIIPKNADEPIAELSVGSGIVLDVANKSFEVSIPCMDWDAGTYVGTLENTSEDPIYFYRNVITLITR